MVPETVRDAATVFGLQVESATIQDVHTTFKEMLKNGFDHDKFILYAALCEYFRSEQPEVPISRLVALMKKHCSGRSFLRSSLIYYGATLEQANDIIMAFHNIKYLHYDTSTDTCKHDLYNFRDRTHMRIEVEQTIAGCLWMRIVRAAEYGVLLDELSPIEQRAVDIWAGVSIVKKDETRVYLYRALLRNMHTIDSIDVYIHYLDEMSPPRVPTQQVPMNKPFFETFYLEPVMPELIVYE